MDVKTVCLGMLSDGEASGYDLKKQFQSTFAHFFAAGYGSIYPALSALAKEGLVECREIAQNGKPDRKVYRITEAGLAHFRETFKNPDSSHKVRSGFLATMVFAHLMSPEQIDAVIQSRVADIDRDLELIRQFECTRLASSSPGMRYVCGCGKTMMQAMKKYIAENRDRLVGFDDRKRTASGI